MKKLITPVTAQQMVQLQLNHHTDLKISKVLGVTVARVCQLRKQFGIPIFSAKKDNSSRNRFVYNSVKEGKATKVEIAKANNISVKTVDRIVKGFV